MLVASCDTLFANASAEQHCLPRTLALPASVAFLELMLFACCYGSYAVQQKLDQQCQIRTIKHYSTQLPVNERQVGGPLQDPVPKMAKFFWLYARPGEKVLLLPHGDMVVCPTALDLKLQSMRRCTS